VLVTTEGAVLLLIDLQQRLVPVIHDNETMVARAVRLAEAAQLLGVPILATEQYPAGLGPTVAPLAAYPQAVLSKTTFSATGDPGFAELLPAGVSQIVLDTRLCPADSAWPAGLRASGDRLGGRGRFA
jgi:Isochorismatase family